MPLYMDVHTLGSEVSAADVAEAHQKDVETQDKYGVDYRSYWVDKGGQDLLPRRGARRGSRPHGAS
jgi:hypothetical protein